MASWLIIKTRGARKKWLSIGSCCLSSAIFWWSISHRYLFIGHFTFPSMIFHSPALLQTKWMIFCDFATRKTGNVGSCNANRVFDWSRSMSTWLGFQRNLFIFFPVRRTLILAKDRYCLPSFTFCYLATPLCAEKESVIDQLVPESGESGRKLSIYPRFSV